MASDSWFYSDGGKSFGPVDEEVIQSLIADGTVGREHFVMEEGTEDWEKVSESKFAPLLDQIWYYSDTQKTFGPSPEAEIRELINSGAIADDHFVMRASEEDWSPFAESKFASTKIKGPESPSSEVMPTPLRRNPATTLPRKKTEVRTGENGSDPPPNSKKTNQKKTKPISEASVPKSGTKPAEKSGKLKAELNATKKEAETLMRRLAKAENERDDTLKDSRIATKKMATIESELLQLNKQFDRSVDEAKKKKKEIASLREDLEVTEKKLEAIATKKKKQTECVTDLQSKLKSSSEVESTQSERIAKLENSLDEAQTQLKGVRNQLEEATGQLATAEEKQTPESDSSAKIKRLQTELLETSSLLAKAKERQPAQEQKIRRLESELSKTKVQLTDARDPLADLSDQINALEEKLKNTGTAESGNDTSGKVALLESKLEKAESASKTAQGELAKAKIKLRETQANLIPPPSANRQSKVAWATAAIAILFAIAAGVYAWIEHGRADNLAGEPGSSDDLSAVQSALADTRSELDQLKAASKESRKITRDHAAFSAQILDKIAAVSGPVNPDLIAELRRETESHFGLDNDIDPLDAETAERAAQMIADGDTAHSAGLHADARNAYRDASLFISPLLEKYPSQAFWRGDLISANTRHARAELALGKMEAADEALEKAESQLAILKSDDPIRAATRTGELAKVWEAVGDAAAATGDVEHAGTAFAKALTIGSDFTDETFSHRSLHTKLGDVSVSAGQLNNARDLYIKALSDGPEKNERVELLGKLAQVERKLGKLPEALAKAEECLAHFRGAANKQPVAETLRDFANSSNLLGEIRRDSGDFTGAVAAHTDAGTVFQNLLEVNPKDEEAKRELAITGIRFGEVEMAQEKYTAARAKFEENLPTFRMLVGGDPDDIEALKDLEYLHLNIARSHAMENDHESALSAYADALRVSELLSAAAPKNLSLTRNLADWKSRIGDYQRSLGKLDLARDNLRDALRVFTVLAAENDTDLEIKRQIAELNKTLGDLEMAISPEVAVTPDVIGDPDSPPTPPVVQNQGEPHYRGAIAKAKELIEADPDNPAMKRDLGIAHEKLATFLMTASRFADAQGEYQRCLEVRKRLVDGSERPEPIWIHELSRTYSDLAFIQSQTGTIGIGEQYYIAALTQGEAAVVAADKTSGQVPAEWIAQNGETYLRLGEIDQAERQYYQARRRFQRAVDILRILTATHDQDDWKISLVLAYAGLSSNYEKGDPRNPSLARALSGEALKILKKMDAEGKLTRSEQAWIPRLRKKTG